MKRNLLIVLISAVALFTIDVYACGEIKELKSDIGTISIIDSSNYLITVPEGTESVTLDATTDYTWVENYGPRTVSTSNKAELKVDGKECGFGIYTYFVKFKTISNLIAENTTPDVPMEDTQTPSTNIEASELKLSALQIEGYELEFKPDKLQYSIDVEYDVMSLRITAKSTDDSAVIQISDNAFSLKEGLNVITVTLKDTLGHTQTYMINVNRSKLKSSNNFLANITINGYQLNFDPSITSYNVSIRKESMLTISAVTESELATYEILGNNNLEDGSVITIRTTAEDGSIKDYIINIKKEFNIMDYWIYIVIILLIVLLILLLLITKKKKNQKKLGPESITAQTTTAGVIKEIAPQNSLLTPESTQQPEANASAPTEKATLKIIEPTNIEDAEPTTNGVSADEDSPTEIFQL